MASKKSQDPNITFTLKRDFGLSQHRLALPPEELDNPSKNGAKIDVPSEKKQRRKSGMFSLQSDKSATMQSKGSTGRYGGRMTRLMQTNYETKKHSHKPPRSAPSTPPLASRHANHGGKYSPDPGRPSPSLHSRLVKKEMLGSDGEKRGSLENLKQLYGLDKEHQNIDTGDLIRLSVISKGAEERQVILRKKRDGLGMHLSAGPPPVYVEFTDRGGEAAAAGVKVGDEILEVNGHRCKTMQLLELMQLKSLLQHVAASIGKDAKQKHGNEVEVTVTSIDSEVSSDENESEKEEVISNSDWQRIQKEQKKMRDTELPIDASLSSRKQTTKKVSKDRSTTIKSAGKVELGDKEWEKMKEKQELIFNTAAPSSIIVSTTAPADTTLTLPVAATTREQTSPSKPKKKFSIFSRKGPKDSKQAEEKSKAKVEVKATSSSATDKATVQTRESKKSVSKKEMSKLDHEKSKVQNESSKSSVKRSPTTDAMLLADDTNKASTPSRSKSAEPIASHTQNDKIGAKHKGGKSGGLKGLFSKSKVHKTGLEGTDSGDIDLSAVPVTVPILGVREGRSRRDVGLTRAETKRRRPTNPSAMLAAREEALAARRRTYTEILDSVGGEKESTTVVNPVIRQSSYVPRPQSGALSKKERQQIQRLISEPSPKPQRANISSAAMVAEAAALRKQKSQETDEEIRLAGDDSPTMKSVQQSTKLDAKSEITVAKPEENRAKEVDSRSLRRRKSVDMPVKVLTLERKHKERKSNDSNQPVSPTSEKADAPSWVAVAQNKQKRSIQLYHSELPEDLSSKKTELSYETNPNQSQSQVGETVVGNVKSRMAMFEKK